MGLVGEDEATALADRLQAATDRYQALADSSLYAGELLDKSRAALRHLVITYQELGAWMDGAERRLRKARPLAINVDPLLKQMDDLAVNYRTIKITIVIKNTLFIVLFVFRN